jgi:GT2 family glycosyltransferase
MWKTSVAQELRFRDAFEGYCQAEDLEFSLRARRCGRLVMCGSARLLHLQEPSGRTDEFRLGYMAIHNRYCIHRSCLTSRSGADAFRFVYAFGIDTLMLLRHLVRPGRALPLLDHLRGRAAAAFDIVLGKQRRLGLGGHAH